MFYPITADGAMSQLSFWMIIGRSSIPRFLRHCEIKSDVMKQGVGWTRVDVSAVTANNVAPFSRGPSSNWTPLEDWKAIKNKTKPTIDICELKWNCCIFLLFQLEIVRTPKESSDLTGWKVHGRQHPPSDFSALLSDSVKKCNSWPRWECPLLFSRYK